LHLPEEIGINAHYAAKSVRVSAVTRDQEVFDRFLLRLDPDRDRAAEQYENMRRKLVKYFQWRDCGFPEDHADEVLKRMIGKIAQGEDIQNPFSYCYGVARMVLLEIRKDRAREQTAVRELGQSQPPSEHERNRGLAVECLNRCLQTLSPENTHLILKYYEDKRGAKSENRKQLARDLSIPLNALRIRAHRLRETLEECVQKCLENEKR
jgi:DNA-directed RNA polymerase specialized sigma24 family protein